MPEESLFSVPYDAHRVSVSVKDHPVVLVLPESLLDVGRTVVDGNGGMCHGPSPVGLARQVPLDTLDRGIFRHGPLSVFGRQSDSSLFVLPTFSKTSGPSLPGRSRCVGTDLRNGPPDWVRNVWFAQPRTRSPMSPAGPFRTQRVRPEATIVGEARAEGARGGGDAGRIHRTLAPLELVEVQGLSPPQPRSVKPVGSTRLRGLFWT